MRILMLNWRDIKNPRAGGAEWLSHGLLNGWAEKGNECVLFSSMFRGAKRKERLGNYTVVRAGNRFTVYCRAYQYYRRFFKGRFDVVIDQVNTIPFFTPFYVKERRIAYFNQLCREVWFYETPFPLSVFSYIAELLYLNIYKRIPCMVISDSTKKSLLGLGFRNVRVFPIAIDQIKANKIKKERNTVIYVGRLMNSKRVHHIIKALFHVKESIPSVRLLIVGTGNKGYEKELVKLVSKLKLRSNVTFFGYVDIKKRNELMARAQAIVVASVREGWGLIVTEANLFGTPAVVYDISGLEDAVVKDVTGLVTRKNSPEELAASVVRLLKDNKLRKRLSENAIKDAKRCTWSNAIEKSLKIIKDFCGK